MSNFDQGTSAEDPAAYAARMAAMQRAMQQGNLGPAGPGSAGGIGAGGVATGSTGASGPSTVAPDYSDLAEKVQSPDAQTRNSTTTLSGTANQTGPVGTTGSLAPQGPNPIDATNAMKRAAGRTGSLGSGAAPITNTGAAAPTPTPAQVIAGGSTGASALPTTATTGGSLAGALAGSNAQQRTDTGAAPFQTPAAAQQGATGAVTPQVPTGAGTGTTGAGTGTTGTGGTGDLAGLTGQIVQQIQGLGQSLAAPGTPGDVSAMYLSQSQSILNMITQQEATLRADYAKQGTQMDPATQFAIDKLKETLATNIQTTKEQLNARGLYDSGIELQLENNLQKGTASDQAQLLGTRMSKLQDQLNASLQSLGSQRIATASQFGLAGANAQNSWDSQTRTLAQQREEAALQAMLTLRGQQSQEQTSANSLAAQRAQQAATLAEQQRQYNETFGFDKAKYNETAAATAAQNAEQNAIARAAAAARAGTGATGGGDVRVTQAVNDLRSTYDNREDAAAAIIQNAAALSGTIGSAGIAALEAAANALPSKASVSRGDPAGMR